MSRKSSNEVDRGSWGCAPENTLDLGWGKFGEFHAPLHRAARLPLLLVAAPLEGHGGTISGIWVAVVFGVGGQEAGGAEGAQARRWSREGGQRACRLQGEEERATQRHGGGGGMWHGVAVTKCYIQRIGFNLCSDEALKGWKKLIYQKVKGASLKTKLSERNRGSDKKKNKKRGTEELKSVLHMSRR
jgi:hypothetical protein